MKDKINPNNKNKNLIFKKLNLTLLNNEKQSKSNDFITSIIKQKSKSLKSLDFFTKSVVKARSTTPLIKQWNNGVYNYNNSYNINLPTASSTVHKIIKSFFTSKPLAYNYKQKPTKLSIRRLFRLSLNTILVSKPEIKHYNNKINITVYLYNKKKTSLIKKIKHNMWHAFSSKRLYLPLAIKKNSKNKMWFKRNKGKPAILKEFYFDKKFKSLNTKRYVKKNTITIGLLKARYYPRFVKKLKRNLLKKWNKVSNFYWISKQQRFSTLPFNGLINQIVKNNVGAYLDNQTSNLLQNKTNKKLLLTTGQKNNSSPILGFSNKVFNTLRGKAMHKTKPLKNKAVRLNYKLKTSNKFLEIYPKNLPKLLLLSSINNIKNLKQIYLNFNVIKTKSAKSFYSFKNLHPKKKVGIKSNKMLNHTIFTSGYNDKKILLKKKLYIMYKPNAGIITNLGLHNSNFLRKSLSNIVILEKIRNSIEQEKWVYNSNSKSINIELETFSHSNDLKNRKYNTIKLPKPYYLHYIVTKKKDINTCFYISKDFTFKKGSKNNINIKNNRFTLLYKKNYLVYKFKDLETVSNDLMLIQSKLNKYKYSLFNFYKWANNTTIFKIPNVKYNHMINLNVLPLKTPICKNVPFNTQSPVKNLSNSNYSNINKKILNNLTRNNALLLNTIKPIKFRKFYHLNELQKAMPLKKYKENKFYTYTLNTRLAFDSEYKPSYVRLSYKHLGFHFKNKPSSFFRYKFNYTNKHNRKYNNIKLKMYKASQKKINILNKVNKIENFIHKYLKPIIEINSQNKIINTYSIKIENFLLNKISYMYNYNFIKDVLIKHVMYIHYIKLLSYNNSLYKSWFLTPLKNMLGKVYNKEVRFNFVNLKYIYLSSDLLTQGIVLKLKNVKRNKLNKVLNKVLNLVLISKNNKNYNNIFSSTYKSIEQHFNKYKSLNTLVFNDISNNINKFKLKNTFSKQALSNNTKSHKLNKNLLISNRFRGQSPLENVKSINSKKLPLQISRMKWLNHIQSNTINFIKYKSVFGLKLVAAGRLTKRSTASRAVFKFRHKGNLKNSIAITRNSSAKLIKSNIISNIQYSNLGSKTRNGSFGIKTWINNN